MKAGTTAAQQGGPNLPPVAPRPGEGVLEGVIPQWQTSSDRQGGLQQPGLPGTGRMYTGSRSRVRQVPFRAPGGAVAMQRRGTKTVAPALLSTQSTVQGWKLK